jgi:hypothetical protein
MNEKLKPALIGGLVGGMLSVIPFLDTCGCLWAIGGGVLAGFLYIPKAPVPVTVGEGAILGALAGVVQAAVRIVIGIPVNYAMGANLRIEEALDRLNMRLPMSGMMLIVIGTLVGTLFAIGLSTVGGLIAVPLFEKRKGGPTEPPLPPQSFDSGQPGNFGAGL